MTMTQPEPYAGIALRLAEVRARISAACIRDGRTMDSVTLIAVSKTHPPEAVIAAINAGELNFGENRVEEATGKIASVAAMLPPKSLQPVWHMIGHVQSRKAREVIQHFNHIHSLDSLKLAERYSRFAQELGKTESIRVWLEINISGEAAKSGLNAQGWEHQKSLRNSLWDEIRRMIHMPSLQIAGLMTMAPIVENPEQARPVFSGLRRLRDALRQDFPESDWVALSMGMTDDYEVAIEEGATHIRIGRAIFGERA